MNIAKWPLSSWREHKIFFFLFMLANDLSAHIVNHNYQLSPKPIPNQTNIMFGLALTRSSLVSFLASQGLSTTRSFSRSTQPLAATNYLLKYEYIPDVLEKRGPYREAHIGLAKKMIEENKCLSGGPTGEPNMEVPTGALFVFTDLESAKHYAENDPYVENGIVTNYSIQEWNVVVQKEN
jgi:hypothetical protein